MRDSDVVDQFHHVYGLAYTGTTEQTNFTALGERANQVDNLDAGFEQVIAAAACSANEGALRWMPQRSSSPIGPASSIGLPSTSMMRPRVALPTGTLRCAAPEIGNFQTALQAFGGTHRNGANHAVAQLLLNFQGDVFTLTTFSAW